MPAATMKLSSVKQSGFLGSSSRHSPASPPVDAPRAADVIFEIGVILAVHLALAVVVTLLLRGCTSC